MGSKIFKLIIFIFLFSLISVIGFQQPGKARDQSKQQEQIAPHESESSPLPGLDMTSVPKGPTMDQGQAPSLPDTGSEGSNEIMPQSPPDAKEGPGSLAGGKSQSN
jgi:hypothetical protein